MESSQTRAINEALHYVQSGAVNHGPFSRRSVKHIMERLDQEIDRKVRECGVESTSH